MDQANRIADIVLDRVLGPMNALDPYMLHPDAAFEGFYTKIDLNSSARIALIHSRVPAGVQNRTMVHLTYVPPPPPPPPPQAMTVMEKPFQVTVFFDDYTTLSDTATKVAVDGVERGQRCKDGFSMELANTFSFRYTQNGGVVCKLELPGLVSLSLRDRVTGGTRDEGEGDRQSNRVPWIPDDPASTPAGRLVQLPLPIQWHVHSLDSECEVELSIQSDLAWQDTRKTVSDGTASCEIHVKSNSDTSNTPTEVHRLDAGPQLARMHMEKNWALGFPTSYIWVQARKRPHTFSRNTTTTTTSSSSSSSLHAGESGICIAGGALVTQIHAYLGAYTSGDPAIGTITFAPPFTASICGISPLASMHTHVDADGGEFRLCVVTNAQRTSKLEIVAKVHDKRSFFTLPAPLRRGHVEDYCRQSFDAVITVRVYQRTMAIVGGWQLKETTVFDGGSLEFGGDFHRSAEPLPKW